MKKFYIEKHGFGNAVLYVIKSEDGSEHYNGPHVEQLKRVVQSRHMPEEIEFIEVDLDKEIYQPV